MTDDDAGAVPASGHGPAQAAPARHGFAQQKHGLAHEKHGLAHEQHGRPREKRWRSWRRSRPFWGGLLLLLAGMEILLIPANGLLIKGAIKVSIYTGVGGVFGAVIGVLLIACGLAIWFNATFKAFYGIVGVVLGLASFPATNLGGFLIGMLLAIIGGALAFAWVPFSTAPVPDTVELPAADEPPATEVLPAAETAPAADVNPGTGEGAESEAGVS
jgi:hypothetical protein